MQLNKEAGLAHISRRSLQRKSLRLESSRGRKPSFDTFWTLSQHLDLDWGKALPFLWV